MYIGVAKKNIDRLDRATGLAGGSEANRSPSVKGCSDLCGVSWGSCLRKTGWDVGNGSVNDPGRSRFGKGLRPNREVRLFVVAVVCYTGCITAAVKEQT